MRLIVLLSLLSMSGLAVADPFCITPACQNIKQSQAAELQAYLDYLRAERDAGRMTSEQMRYLYFQKQNELNERRAAVMKPNPQVIFR